MHAERGGDGQAGVDERDCAVVCGGPVRSVQIGQVVVLAYPGCSGDRAQVGGYALLEEDDGGGGGSSWRVGRCQGMEVFQGRFHARLGKGKHEVDIPGVESDIGDAAAAIF